MRHGQQKIGAVRHTGHQAINFFFGLVDLSGLSADLIADVFGALANTISQAVQRLVLAFNLRCQTDQYAR